MNLKRLWDLIGHVSTAYGLLPAMVAGCLASALGYLATLPAIVVVVIAFAIIALSMVLIANLPKFTAYAVIFGILLAGTIWSVRQYRSERSAYSIYVDDIEVGLVPLDYERNFAQRAVVSPIFNNSNDFPVWVRALRHATTLNKYTNGSVAPTPLIKIPPHARYGIPGGSIDFNEPLRRREIANGTIDYQLCYGRTSEALDKSLTYASDFFVTFDDRDGIQVKDQPRVNEQGSCPQ